MEAVIAGWVAGYAMSMLSTLAIVFLAVKSDLGAVGRWFPDTKPMFIALPASMGTVLIWTIIGLVIGSLYDVLELRDQANFLGGPSGPLLAGLGVMAVLPLPFLLLVLRRYWWLWCGLSASFVGLFGWLMPLSAERW